MMLSRPGRSGRPDNGYTPPPPLRLPLPPAPPWCRPVLPFAVLMPCSSLSQALHTLVPPPRAPPSCRRSSGNADSWASEGKALGSNWEALPPCAVARALHYSPSPRPQVCTPAAWRPPGWRPAQAPPQSCQPHKQLNSNLILGKLVHHRPAVAAD